MKQKTTVESRVLEILMECPASRYDDMLLILHYYNRFGYLRAGEDLFLKFVIQAATFMLQHKDGKNNWHTQYNHHR